MAKTKRVVKAGSTASTQVIPVESINALEIFREGGLEPLLKKIEKEVSAFVPDLESVQGRKEIASMAYKVARSKTAIDDARKGLVSDWKKQAAEVDAEGKRARDFLDDLKAKVRKPLDDWEAAEAARLEEEKRLEILNQAHEEALVDHDFWLREQAIKAREAELARQEEERRLKEEAERARKEEEERVKREAEERAAREEKMRQEAQERAEREAEEKVKAERERAERAEREHQEAIERAEREAEERAEREKEREARAKRDQEAAVERERQRAEREAEARERARLEHEAKMKREEEERQADVEHRRGINQMILESMKNQGIGEQTAKKVITLVASGAITRMKIVY